MRLSYFEQESIISVFNRVFGNGELYVFGSRLDDSAKGGDIDLYIKTVCPQAELLDKKHNFLTELEKLLGEQKIDIVFAKDPLRPVEIEAVNKGLKLDIVKLRIEKVINECDKHLKRLREAYAEMSSFMLLTSEKYENLDEEKIRIIDQYFYRFLKLQDAIGEKLFKLALSQYEENIEKLPFIDILNRLEKYSLIKSINLWNDLRKIRNDITHEYDDDPIEMTDLINKLYSKKEVIEDIFLGIKNKLSR
jgi:hypothetical protein